MSSPYARWQLLGLADMSGAQVHAALSLRAAVFVVEQRCAFQDPDEIDAASLHLLGYDAAGQLGGYLRLVPPGVKYAEPSIGRVVTRAQVRGTGMGRSLLAEGIRHAQLKWPHRSIRIGAQHRLEAFYISFGFVSDGDTYIEDDILHVEMVLPAAFAAPNN